MIRDQVTPFLQVSKTNGIEIQRKPGIMPGFRFPKNAPSEGRNAVAVDQSCQLFPRLAHRAVVGGAADIIGEVLLYGENTLDREAFTFIYRGEDG